MEDPFSRVEMLWRKLSCRPLRFVAFLNVASTQGCKKNNINNSNNFLKIAFIRKKLN